MFEQKTKWETCQIEFCECCVAFKCFTQCCCSNINDPVAFVFDFERKVNEMKLCNNSSETNPLSQVSWVLCLISELDSKWKCPCLQWHLWSSWIMMQKEWFMTHLFDAWIVLQTCDSSKPSHTMHKSWCFRFLEDSKNNTLLVKHRFCSFPFWTLTVEFIKRKPIHPSNSKGWFVCFGNTVIHSQHRLHQKKTDFSMQTSDSGSCPWVDGHDKKKIAETFIIFERICDDHAMTSIFQSQFKLQTIPIQDTIFPVFAEFHQKQSFIVSSLGSLWNQFHCTFWIKMCSKSECITFCKDRHCVKIALSHTFFKKRHSLCFALFHFTLQQPSCLTSFCPNHSLCCLFLLFLCRCSCSLIWWHLWLFPRD